MNYVLEWFLINLKYYLKNSNSLCNFLWNSIEKETWNVMRKELNICLSTYLLIQKKMKCDKFVQYHRF